MKQLFYVGALSILAASPSFANGNDRGFYLGGAVGSVSTDFGGIESDGTLYGIYGGYDFNSWFGLETSLMLSGNLENKYFDVYVGTLTVTPTLTFPINSYFSIYTKAGIASMAMELSNSSSSETYSDLTWTYGVGVKAAITPNIVARVSYDVISGEMENDDNFKLASNNFDVDISKLMLGVQYKF